MARLEADSRREIARLVVEAGLPPAEAAARLGVSASTARRWAGRWAAADATARRTGRWMDSPPAGDRGAPDDAGALAIAEASIREAEALMASIGARPVRRPPHPPRPRPRPPARPHAIRRVPARVRAMGWTRRQLGGVGLTLAFIPVGWVGGAALLGGDPRRGLPEESAAGGLRSPAPSRFQPALARAGGRTGGRLVAHARERSILVHSRPGGGRGERLRARRLEGRPLPLVMLVERRRGAWLRVRLPVRPNGSRGWIRADAVRLRSNPYRLRVRLAKNRIEVWRGRRLLGRPKIAVGQALSPTPTGRYFITDLVKARDPRGLYGPYAFGLSAFSPVHTVFRGGPGQIGIHGTNEPERLGTDVSAGCIRVGNRTISRLARILPLGTPVRIGA